MAEENPYSSNQVHGPADQYDPKLLALIAKALTEARECPPTVSGRLLKWPGAPLLLLIGVIGTAFLWYLSVEEDLSLAFPFGFAAMFFGAILRDVDYARQFAKLWPSQSHFIDWQAVENFQKKF